MRKSDHASMKFSKELRSPYLQGNFREFRDMGNSFSKLIPKLYLKFYLLGSMNIFEVFRKKVGFDMLSDNKQKVRQKDLLAWCYENRELVESFFIFDRFIDLVKDVRREAHLFRIEVFLKWITEIYEKNK